jgi:DNA-directed RNA polymerase specialized sigma24 family protein
MPALQRAGESMDPQEHGTSAELLARYGQGDERSAEELFHRYVERLTLLARARLSPRLAGRVDPEDIVLSAWRSFFIGARAGRFSLRRSGDLWRLLVSITMHKLYRQVRWHTADRRSVGSEQSIDSARDEWLPYGSVEPGPEEAVALADELEAVMAQLDGFGRRVLELRLQGEQLAAIAAATERSERTVRRSLAAIRAMLAERLRRARDD